MIVQKKNGNVISFDFREQDFVYSFQDKSLSQQKEILFTTVDTKDISTYTERPEWFRNVGIIWIVLSIGEMILYRSGLIWFLLACIFLLIYWFRTTHFSLLEWTGGNIFVLKDKYHDIIIDKIRSEKKSILRKRYLPKDDQELQWADVSRFEWLRDEGVISQDELREISEKIHDFEQMRALNQNINWPSD